MESWTCGVDQCEHLLVIVTQWVEELVEGCTSLMSVTMTMLDCHASLDCDAAVDNLGRMTTAQIAQVLVAVGAQRSPVALGKERKFKFGGDSSRRKGKHSRSLCRLDGNQWGLEEHGNLVYVGKALMCYDQLDAPASSGSRSCFAGSKPLNMPLSTESGRSATEAAAAAQAG